MAPSRTSQSIILADDHAIVREGIAAFLKSQPGLNLIGTCGDGVAALELILTSQPDFATIDLNMPKLHGLEVLRQVRYTSCPTKMIVLTVNSDQNVVQESFRIGADAYVLKQGPTRHLLDAIRFIQDGGQYLTPLICLVPRSGSDQTREPIATLTEREYEIYALLVEGRRPKDIGRILAISPKTVDSHRAQIMRKLNVSSMVGLIKYAIEHKP